MNTQEYTEAHTAIAWKMAGSILSKTCMDQRYKSAEGDSRLTELAAATNIKNAKKRSFKDVLRISLRL